MVEAHFSSLILFNDGAVMPSFVARVGQDQPRLEEIAATACRASNRLNAFSRQFERLLSVLRDWLREHDEKIQAAHLTVRERDLLFVVMQKDARFDAELTDALTELDISIANDPELKLIDLEVLAVPPLSAEALRAVLTFGTVLHNAQ